MNRAPDAEANTIGGQPNDIRLTQTLFSMKEACVVYLAI